MARLPGTVEEMLSLAVVTGVALLIGFRPNPSMPTGLRWFADYQPFTPLIETVRGLLTGTPIGNHAVIALAWSAAITLASYLWAKNLYNRDRTQ